MNNILKECPCCNNKLIVKSLECENCHTIITGKFKTSPFDTLNEDQLQFILCFIKNDGNIKSIEKELGISYPTVKKYLEEVKQDLGFRKDSRQEILNKVKIGEISLEQAREILNNE